MSRSSVIVFAEIQEWSVLVIEDGGESRHPFRFQKRASSFANGQRARQEYAVIDFLLLAATRTCRSRRDSFSRPLGDAK